MSADDVLSALDETDNFVQVPRAVLRELSPRDAVVLCWLRYRGRGGTNGWVDVSLDELGAEIGLSVDQIKRAIAALCEAGLVEWRVQSKFSRRRDYRVMVRNRPVNRAEVHRPDGAESPRLLPQESLEVLDTAGAIGGRIAESITAAFDAFWDEYPRKVVKRDARVAFEAALKLRPQPDIAAGLERWLVHWRTEQTETKYIPHPATWLRGRRWEDEPVTSPPNRAGQARNRAELARPEIITNREGRGGVLEL